MAERADLRTSLRRLPITTTAAAVLAIVAAFSVIQRVRAAQHRYDDVDFIFFYGWWTDYSTGGNPWILQARRSELRPGLARPRYCKFPPSFVEVFSPLARFDQKTAFWVWESIQMLCLIAAVLILARANAPPLAAPTTIIVLSLVLMSRQFAGALVGAQVTPMLLALLVGFVVLRAEGSPRGRRTLHGAGGVGETIPGRRRRIFPVRPSVARARLDRRLLRRRCIGLQSRPLD